MLFLDTHAVAWLYDRLDNLFASSARNLIESNDLSISPIVELELEYLFEIGKLTAHSAEIVEYLDRTVQLRIDDMPFPTIIQHATRLKWTRDPFDRIITAHADLRDAPLLTRDRRIHNYYMNAVW